MHAMSELRPVSVLARRARGRPGSRADARGPPRGRRRRRTTTRSGRAENGEPLPRAAAMAAARVVPAAGHVPPLPPPLLRKQEATRARVMLGVLAAPLRALRRHPAVAGPARPGRCAGHAGAVSLVLL